MKKLFVVIFVSIFVATGWCGAAFATGNDLATDIQRADAIRANCRAAQSTLQQVSRGDTVVRINRGRAYENMLKLMFAFNSRVAANNRSEPQLSEITASAKRGIERFRADYDQYQDALTRAIGVDCANQPVTFYEALIDARAKRVAVNQDIQNLDKQFGNYKKVVNGIADEIKGKSSS